MTGNQEHLPEGQRQYLRYPSGIKKAVLIHILNKGECPCDWEKNRNNFTDGRKVYRRLSNI